MAGELFEKYIMNSVVFDYYLNPSCFCIKVRDERCCTFQIQHNTNSIAGNFFFLNQIIITPKDKSYDI